MNNSLKSQLEAHSLELNELIQHYINRSLLLHFEKTSRHAYLLYKDVLESQDSFPSFVQATNSASASHKIIDSLLGWIRSEGRRLGAKHQKSLIENLLTNDSESQNDKVRHLSLHDFSLHVQHSLDLSSSITEMHSLAPDTLSLFDSLLADELMEEMSDPVDVSTLSDKVNAEKRSVISVVRGRSPRLIVKASRRKAKHHAHFANESSSSHLISALLLSEDDTAMPRHGASLKRPGLSEVMRQLDQCKFPRLGNHKNPHV